MNKENLQIEITPNTADNYVNGEKLSFSCKKDSYWLLRSVHENATRLGFTIKDMNEALFDLAFEIETNNEIAEEIAEERE